MDKWDVEVRIGRGYDSVRYVYRVEAHTLQQAADAGEAEARDNKMPWRNKTGERYEVIMVRKLIGV